VIRYVFPVLRMTSYLDILACNKRRREVVRYIETGSSGWHGFDRAAHTQRDPPGGSLGTGQSLIVCWYDDADQVP